MDPALKLSELLAYAENESRRWQKWFQENPAALDVKLDIAQAKDVRNLVLHIVAVDTRYAERLLGEDVTPYETFPSDIAVLFETGERAFRKLRGFLDSATEEEWKKVIEFPSRSMGTLTSSKRKIFVHTLLHSTRHWAQLATTLRSAGYKQDWQHDFLFSEAIQ
ncbi:MAG: hypothetical protein JWO20_568 [Candidatus Angelobacter sp.]|jgi:uncharacterized damage-inducible protein DinB|nr:hypothetical protein [Candidatus Angelobacter sp.]